MNVDFNGPSLYFLGSHEGIKERHPRKSRYFTAVGQSFVKTVADRHGHAAYHNKHVLVTSFSASFIVSIIHVMSRGTFFSFVLGVLQLFPSLHAHLSCTTLLERKSVYIHYWKKRVRDCVCTLCSCVPVGLVISADENKPIS